ncbi:hypothetical protein LWC34_12550 [Kibdelosporangium philippinense]|uniref:DUF4064 domain-containing protein n=1 Tax=Kibdelosporangium philippinense TaxID=211113 RepID=A0ABS8Z6Z1_9PSEU|nr:hypothetical protein [Kibdelosporangium philippinense]MCE7003649.1 hypothetical protein [Kibdelosporangium philippinense]
MSQTPPTPATECSSLGRSALILSMIAAAVFGLLAGCGAGLRGFRLGEPVHLSEAFTALAWISTTLAPALAWTFVGLAVLVGGIALITRGIRSGPRPIESILKAVLAIALYALAPVVLLSIGPFAVWLVLWLETGFGTCVPPTCEAVPAVP